MTCDCRYAAGQFVILDVLPPEIAAFWNRAAMPTDPNVFPPS